MIKKLVEQKEYNAMDNYEVVVRINDPGDLKLMEGNEGAFCKCGRELQIKRPKIKTWHKIKCPKCGFIINLFCGECPNIFRKVF